MNTDQKNNQSGQGSKVDDTERKNTERHTENGQDISQANAEDIEAIDDDFLSGDNEKKTYPNNQNNPNPDYNKQFMSPGPRSNANIGGNEDEYENPTTKEERYDEDISANDDYQNNVEDETLRSENPKRSDDFNGYEDL
jgi:hypothetical protein